MAHLPLFVEIVPITRGQDFFERCSLPSDRISCDSHATFLQHQRWPLTRYWVRLTWLSQRARFFQLIAPDSSVLARIHNPSDRLQGRAKLRYTPCHRSKLQKEKQLRFIHYKPRRSVKPNWKRRLNELCERSTTGGPTPRAVGTIFSGPKTSPPSSLIRFEITYNQTCLITYDNTHEPRRYNRYQQLR